jgi:hypothetical protein
MNKKKYKYYLFTVLLLGLPFALIGQQDLEFPKAEKLALFTDRGLYIAGESIHFAAFVTNHAPSGLSDIVYAEIIESDGTQVAGAKFRLIQGASHGCLTIPTSILTGNYYLRLYTKYMRNVGPRAFAYVQLEIINRLKKEVLKGNEKVENTAQKISGNSSGDNVILNTMKKVYRTKEKVNVTINTNGSHSDRIQRLCVAVVPEMVIPNKMIPMHSPSRKINVVRFFPEMRGPSITGTLQDSVTKKGEAGVNVNLSIIGKGKIFMAAQTDSTGHFFFSLPPYTGNHDVFIGAQNVSGIHHKILVDNDFSTKPIRLPDPVFKMDSSERPIVLRMAQNLRVKQLFYSDSLLCSKKNQKVSVAFYGKPSYTLKMSEYIQLPTLEAYLDNLSSLVKVRSHHGEKYLKIVSLLPQMAYLRPLVLVDGVAIDNQEKILALSPSNISRIEVVNKPYVIGNMTYGGIVNFISIKGDFAGIDLPSSGMFLNYDFLHNNCRCAITTPDSIGQPDTRNTLYWNPDVSLNSGKEVHFSFITGDTPGKYAILIQGIDANGKPFSKKDIIVVKTKP